MIDRRKGTLGGALAALVLAEGLGSGVVPVQVDNAGVQVRGVRDPEGVGEEEVLGVRVGVELAHLGRHVPDEAGQETDVAESEDGVLLLAPGVAFFVQSTVPFCPGERNPIES